MKLGVCLGGRGESCHPFCVASALYRIANASQLILPRYFFFPFNLHIKRQGLKFSNKNKVVNCKEHLSDNHYASEIAQPIIKF